ncbi:hypothetical protein KW420_09315 [Vibrio fluvialis]|nr:hypothetical protein [Vibrio fluvialis]
MNSNTVINMPSQLFTMRSSFKAVANGSVYIGEVDTDPTIPTNQIQVYIEQENGTLVPVAQPIKINSAGLLTASGQVQKFVLTNAEYSMTVQNSYGVDEFYFPRVYDQGISVALEVEERLIGQGAKIYRGSNGKYVQNGDVVPSENPEYTHLSITISGKVEDVRMSSLASGLVSDLTENSATIDGEPITLHRFLNGGYQATSEQLYDITPLNGEQWFDNTDKNIVIGDGVTQGGIEISKKSGAVLSFDTIDAALNNAALKEGYSLNLTERNVGYGGSSTWDVVLTSNVTPNGYDIVQSVAIPTLSLAYRVVNAEIDLASIGFLADRNVTTGAGTDNSPVLQRAIDLANSLYLGGSFGGGGLNVLLPEGQAVYSGFVMKQGANLIGKGSNVSVLCLSGSTATGVKCAAADTGSFSDQVSRGTFQGFSLYSNESSPTSQTQWNAIGFSRWKTIDVLIDWFGGCNGISVTGATLAGSGGPAQWYNDFYSVFLIRRASMPSGGIALNIGDTDISFEQATSWNFFGGRISGAGSGTGAALRTTGFNFYGVKFEGLDTANDIGSNGTRGADRNQFFGCYYEGNTTNRNVRSNGQLSSWRGTFVTGGVDSIAAGTKTTFDDPGVFKSYAGNSGTEKWEIELNSSARRPTVRGTTFPCLDLTNSGSTDLTIGNGAATSLATKHFRVLTNNASVVMFEAGSSQLAPGNDNVRSSGAPSARWSTVYAGTGTISTSDERVKSELLEIDEVEKSCALELKKAIRKYKFKDMIELKGEDESRIHFGVGAQTVKSIFENHGLDPSKYALFCFDEWEDDFETIEAILDEDGNEIEPERVICRKEAGNRYGIRYEELLAFILSAL